MIDTSQPQEIYQKSYNDEKNLIFGAKIQIT